MAGVVRIAATGRNAMLDALRVLIDGGSVEIYTGPQPAAPETPIGAQVKLGTLALASPVGPLSGSGVLSFGAISPDAGADAAGVAAFGRVKMSGGTALIDLPAGVTGSGAALELDTLTVAQ